MIESDRPSLPVWSENFLSTGINTCWVMPWSVGSSDTLRCAPVDGVSFLWSWPDHQIGLCGCQLFSNRCHSVWQRQSLLSLHYSRPRQRSDRSLWVEGAQWFWKLTVQEDVSTFRMMNRIPRAWSTCPWKT